MSSSTTATTALEESPQQPKLTKDPRFRAARKLIESGRDGAIAMFGTLLEEARTKYGEASIESAPAYAEYGMALFRESQRQKEEAAKEDGEEEEEGDEEEEEDKKPAAVETKSEITNGDGKSKEETEKETDGKEEKDKDAAEEETTKDGEAKDDEQEEGDQAEVEDGDQAEEEEQAEGDDEEGEGEEEEEEDDEELAFAMMETAFAIYDQYVQLAKSSAAANKSYLQWAEREQLPRILSNIGDLLSCMGRHADSADAYTRELFFRDANLQVYENNSKDGSLAELMDRRKNVEANVLVATELLECEPGQDVITTETKTCLVKAAERDDYATGYYEQARDQLQETVYLMAKLLAAAKDDKTKADLQKEKENVCFASALVMGVGERLAQREDEKLRDKEEPVKKKAKTS